MNKTGLGERIRNVKKEQDLTSEALAELIEKHPSSVRLIEKASRLPSLSTFVDICNKLNASADYLLFDSLKKKPVAEIEMIPERLQSLSPQKAELAVSLINTIIDKLEETHLAD